MADRAFIVACSAPTTEAADFIAGKENISRGAIERAFEEAVAANRVQLAQHLFAKFATVVTPAIFSSAVKNLDLQMLTWLRAIEKIPYNKEDLIVLVNDVDALHWYLLEHRPIPVEDVVLHALVRAAEQGAVRCLRVIAQDTAITRKDVRESGCRAYHAAARAGFVVAANWLRDEFLLTQDDMKPPVQRFDLMPCANRLAALHFSDEGDANHPPGCARDHYEPGHSGRDVSILAELMADAAVS